MLFDRPIEVVTTVFSRCSANFGQRPKVVVTIALLLLFTVPAIAQQSPILPFDQRIEIAKKLITVDRAAAIADPSKQERAYLFTETSAHIDPKWTADFIINNPIKSQQHEGAAYENNAIQSLLGHPQLLTEEQVLKLVDYYPFMSLVYLRLAIDNLPKEAKFDSLREKLAAKVAGELGEMDAKLLVFGMFGPSNFSEIADHDADLAKKIRKKIDGFYHSGQAEKTWKKSSAQQSQSSAYQIGKLKKLAPAGFDISFLGNAGSSDTVYGYELFQVLGDNSLSDDEKANWLGKKQRLLFGKEVHQAKSTAAQLGLVAQTNLEKALDWSESASSPILQTIAKLSIAPVLAKQDKEAAISLVLECYQNCLNIDPQAPASRGDTILRNTHPSQIAIAGLRIADHIDKKLLDDCIAKTIELIERDLDPTNEYDRMGRVFRSLAAIARYDHAAAKKIFEQCSDEVQIANANDFFFALVAIDPNSVLEEYETLPPDKDSPANQTRFRVRQAIAPALVQRDEELFWQKLQGYHQMDFPKSIFDSPK